MVLGVCLSTVAYFTVPVIEKNRTNAELASADELWELLSKRQTLDGLNDQDIKRCEFRALVKQTVTDGYGGPMTVLVGYIGADLVAVRVPAHRETPGFSDILHPDDWLGSFGREELVAIDTVSRATITSRSVLRAVRSTLREVEEDFQQCLSR